MKYVYGVFGFDQEAICAQFAAGHMGRPTVIGGEKEKARSARAGDALNLSEQLRSVHLRHVPIRQNEFEAAAAKAQGQNVVINITQNINGSGLSKDELTSVLEKNNKSVIREVADQIKTGKSF